ncbi:hypothetical protein CBL_11018 [Carabus blaptoides fortunei]
MLLHLQDVAISEMSSHFAEEDILREVLHPEREAGKIRESVELDINEISRKQTAFTRSENPKTRLIIGVASGPKINKLVSQNDGTKVVVRYELRRKNSRTSCFMFRFDCHTITSSISCSIKFTEHSIHHVTTDHGPFGQCSDTVLEHTSLLGSGLKSIPV